MQASIGKQGPKRRPPFERFWGKVSINPNGCWDWTGANNGVGYGQMRDVGKNIYAHRYSYEALSGIIPDGMHLDHLCRNRSCVNPLHLEAVTCRENLLRGVGPTAKHAATTHCPKGHEYSGANLMVRPNGQRRCRTCVYAQNNAGATRRNNNV